MWTGSTLRGPESLTISLSHGWKRLAAGRWGGFFALRDISEHRRLEAERERLSNGLREAAGQVRQLSGLLPICASCKKIRNDEGYWQQIEAYVRDHSEAEFSHSLCPDCARRLYPQFAPGPTADPGSE